MIRRFKLDKNYTLIYFMWTHMGVTKVQQLIQLKVQAIGMLTKIAVLDFFFLILITSFVETTQGHKFSAWKGTKEKIEHFVINGLLELKLRAINPLRHCSYIFAHFFHGEKAISIKSAPSLSATSLAYWALKGWNWWRIGSQAQR